MQLREVMTRNVDVIRPDVTLVEAARKMKSLDIGPIPVCDEHKILGMLTDRDITTRAVAEGRDLAHTQVREVMSPEVIYCYEDQEVEDAAQLMQQRQVRRLLVLNRQREVAGIVSLGDLAGATGGQRLAGETLAGVVDDSHDWEKNRPAQSRRAAQPEHERPEPLDRARQPIGTPSRHAEEVAAALDRPRRSADHSARETASAPLQRDLTGRKTVAGLFPDRRSGERAIDDLKQAGFHGDQIGIVMRDMVEGRSKDHPKETHAAEGAVTGALGGGVLGGVAGYLIAIGALTIPGLGPVLVGGALAQALGVVAGTAAVGAGIGAAAGGLVGVLVGMGIPEEEARHFERSFGHEQALVTVKAGERVMEALAILEMNDADTGLGRKRNQN